jgi:hypothetical protein
MKKERRILPRFHLPLRIFTGKEGDVYGQNLTRAELHAHLCRAGLNLTTGASATAVCFGCAGIPPLSRSRPVSYRPELMEPAGGTRRRAAGSLESIYPDGWPWPRLRPPATDVMISGGRDSCVGWIEHASLPAWTCMGRWGQFLAFSGW